MSDLQAEVNRLRVALAFQTIRLGGQGYFVHLPLTTILHEALGFAEEVHANQFRSALVVQAVEQLKSLVAELEADRPAVAER